MILRRPLATLLLFAAVCTAAAAPPADNPKPLPVKAVSLKVEGATVTLVTAFPLTITAPEGGFLYRWSGTPGLKLIEKRNVCIVTSGPKGTHTVTASYVTYDKSKDPPITEVSGESTFAIGSVTPDPTPDDPPGPGPTPDKNAPFAGVTPAGMRVLIVEDPLERSALPLTQLAIIQGAAVRKYLNDKTPMGSDGKHREWWILPKDTDVSGLDKHWQDAYKMKRDSLPWLYIGDGKSGESIPLPKTVDEFWKVAKKYGG